MFKSLTPEKLFTIVGRFLLLTTAFAAFLQGQVARANVQVLARGSSSSGSCEQLESYSALVETNNSLVKVLRGKLNALPESSSLKELLAETEASAKVDFARATSEAKKISGYAKVAVDRVYLISTPSLKSGDGLGWIDIASTSVTGEQTLVQPQTTTITLFGSTYCDALKKNGSPDAALDAAVSDLFKK